MSETKQNQREAEEYKTCVSCYDYVHCFYPCNITHYLSMQRMSLLIYTVGGKKKKLLSQRWNMCRALSCVMFCVPFWSEHGASMVGELFSGGVCQKENRENCTAEAVMDGRFTEVKVCMCACMRLAGVESRRQGRWVLLSLKPHVEACRDCLCAYVRLCIGLWVAENVKVFMSSQTYDSARGDSPHWAVNLARPADWSWD